MAKATLQTWLTPAGVFSMFNREERNAVAMLYAALLQRGNLERFAQAVGWHGLGDPQEAEVFVEWTYARDLWNLHTDNLHRRQAILGLLRPTRAPWLQTCSVERFNAFFGATPRPSNYAIQYPGRWSLLRFAERIGDADEFRRTCVFKWAFNIKLDLVMHGAADQLLCVEAKWDSVEGFYPSSPRERAEFARRGLELVSQTEVQRYLVEELLGFDATFSYLTRAGTASSDSHATLTWRDAFSTLEMDGLPPFVRDWINALETP